MLRHRHVSGASLNTPIALGDGVSVTAICDAVADHRLRVEEYFPREPAGGWGAVNAQHAGLVGPEGRWRLPMNAFLVRTSGATVLVDTGVGAAGTVAAEVFGTSGTLPEQLADLGVTPDAVDLVVFTHLHSDHVGWAADLATGEPTFPRARHLVHRLEWEANHADGTPEPVLQSLDPLGERGLVDLVELGALADGLELVDLPGHTPGHGGVVVSGPSGRAVLVGDAFNHPQQVAEPEIPSFADADRERAVATRRDVLARVASGEWPLLGSAHMPGAWWSAAPSPA